MTAVVGLEQSRSPADLVRVVDALQERLRDPRDGELMRAFVEWVRRLARGLTPREEELPPTQTLEDAKVTLEERVREWGIPWLEEGRKQGLAHERASLCRMAATRFGPEAVEPLPDPLDRIADPDRISDVGDWLVRCDTGEEFLTRMSLAAAESGRRDG